MEKVYDLHQHTHCVIMHIGKEDITTHIFSTSNRHFISPVFVEVKLASSISYNKQRTDAICVGRYYGRGEDDIVIDNFRDGLYSLFKKDKETWDEEDIFLMKAVSDYLPLAIKETMKKMKLEIESFDLFHYVFVVPSEWEEEIRDDMIRPIFVQSGLISNQDHQDRLLFFTDIESIFYNYSFERGDNTILCRVIPEEEEIVIKFYLVRTTNSLFDFPNAKLFPKVVNSSSVSVTKGDIEGRIKDFLNAKLFTVVTKDGGGLAKSIKQFLISRLVPSDQDQMIEAIIKGINSWNFRSLDKEKDPEKEPWIIFKKRWMLCESQKEFISSLCPSIICAEIGTFLLGYMKSIVSNNVTKNYKFLLLTDGYSGWQWKDDLTWLEYILEYNSRSLNYTTISTLTNKTIETFDPKFILEGAGRGVFEAIQHSDMYCKPRIVSSRDLATSSSVFLNSRLDAIVNLDISLGSTLLTCSILDEDGLIQQIYDHDYFIKDNHLPPLGHFYTFSNTTTLTVKEQFIPFAEGYLLGNLSDLIVDDDVSIKNGILLEMKTIMGKVHSEGEVLVSTSKQKYIKAFILMYMVYIKKEIMCKLPDQMDMKIGYAVSVEAMLLNNTVKSKDKLRDTLYASGLVPKGDYSKKLRITTQGERILPAIQKSLELALSVKSYFLLCQLHEDYLQLSLHQVVTAFSPEEKEQESIIVQDEIIPIQNTYDSLCSYMWYSLLEDSSLIELCEMHNTSDNNENIDLFSSKIKAEFFTNLKGHISDNVLQNHSGTRIIDAINLTSSCNCKVRLSISDMIDISFTPFLQDIACTLSASLLNKELFGNYMDIDYLFSVIHFNNNPQLQDAFAKILEEEADDFNLETGIDTSCLVVSELFSQLLQPVVTQRPFCYKDFKTGALQQVCSENYVTVITQHGYEGPMYKSKITDTKTIECVYDTAFPFLDKGGIINNNGSNRRFYLRNQKDSDFYYFYMDVYRFETMNYSEDNETLFLDDNVYQHVDKARIEVKNLFECQDVDVPVMISIRYVFYTSSLQFSVKLVGADTSDKKLTGVIETGEPLTLLKL